MTLNKKLPTGAFLCAVDQIGDMWTFLILREAFFGAKQFSEFATAIKVSRARLTERLKHMVETGLLAQHDVVPGKKRQEYRLTAKSIDVYPIALCMISWASRWRDVTPPTVLKHKTCGHDWETKVICRHCDQPVYVDEIDWPSPIGLDDAYSHGSNVKGWRRMTSFDGISTREEPAFEAYKTFGDRWSMLIMYGAQRGPFHFSYAQKILSLATNILTDRLKHLVNQNLLERTDESRRAAYVATESGRSLFAPLLAMRTWAVDNEKPGPNGWSKVIHKTCGSDLMIKCACVYCNETANPKHIDYNIGR